MTLADRVAKLRRIADEGVDLGPEALEGHVHDADVPHVFRAGSVNERVATEGELLTPSEGYA